jgi:hypothetical protein
MGRGVQVTEPVVKSADETRRTAIELDLDHSISASNSDL